MSLGPFPCIARGNPADRDHRPATHGATRPEEALLSDPNLALVKGTVDLLILKALSLEPKHGYAVSEWIEAVTDGTLLVEEGTLYPALHRLEGRGWIEAEWGRSENNRRAKFYRLTDEGRARLEGQATKWARYTQAVARALESTVLRPPAPQARAGEVEGG